ncbi:MAG: hypothetical protein FWE42_00150 [Defluviitaleaceae bacterium]|nr:hypothetical protein [Defluviitaleaceae bacterium]
MIISEYLDLIENTDQEQLLRDKIVEIEEHLVKAASIPVLGKTLTALIAFGQAESVEAFKQSEHYVNLKDWNIEVADLEAGHFSITPGPVHMVKVKKIAVAIGIVVALLVLLKKCCCRKKKCTE